VDIITINYENNGALLTLNSPNR